jgi:RNA-directed DNA polymerase
MTADLCVAGAASHAEEGWHTINWASAYRIVCRLQARIVKATQAGRWGKVKALQYLLTRSFSGKALAVRRVTENQGKATPGDREIWDTPEKRGGADSTEGLPSPTAGVCTSPRRTARCVLWASPR